MFDIAWSELLVIAVVALIVVGPKDLPRLLRSLGQIMRKLRRMSNEFKAGVDDFIRETELEEVRKSIHHVSNFDPRSRPEKFIDLDNPDKDCKAGQAADAGDPTGGVAPLAPKAAESTVPAPDILPDADPDDAPAAPGATPRNGREA